jgi:hypothetical protein
MGPRYDVTRGNDARAGAGADALNPCCRVRPGPVYQLVALRKET